MKKRWMQSVIEASKLDVPAIPFQRSLRREIRVMPDRRSLRHTA